MTTSTDNEQGADMATVIVQYKVKPDQVETNKELVRAVYDELRERQPGDTRYITFQLEDGVSFIHLNWNDREDGTFRIGDGKEADGTIGQPATARAAR
jgi:translation elongation factor EF-1beta